MKHSLILALLFMSNVGLWAQFTAGGDLSGTNTNQEVIGILGNSLPSLSSGYLAWNGSAWVFNATIPIANGGTGATTASAAILNIDGISSVDTSPQTLSGPISGPEFNGIYEVSPGTGTISAAYSALLTTGRNSGMLHLTCGIYYDNVTITTGSIGIVGDSTLGTGNSSWSSGCVTVYPNPAHLSDPVFTIQASAGDPIYGVEIGNMNIVCPATTACGDAIQINGPANQTNDWHYLHDLIIQSETTSSASYGFDNGINFVGRSIWSTVFRVAASYSRNAGLNNSSASVVQELHVIDSRFANNWNYGAYINSTASPTIGPTRFDTVNVEFNGASAPSDCAGLYVNGTSSFTITGGDYEGNCSSATAAADIRITGTYNQAFNIIGATFNQSASEWGIYNDTTLTTGYIAGNFFNGGASNKTIYIASTDSASNVHVGSNYNIQTPSYVVDGNGQNHVSEDSPFGDSIGASGTYTNPVTSNTIAAGPFDHLEIYSASASIKNITGGYSGRILKLTNITGTLTLATGGTAGENIFLMGGASSETVPVGESVTLYYNGYYQYWFEVSSSSEYTASTFNIGGYSATAAVGNTQGKLMFAQTTATGSIGGSALTVGSCASGTASISQGASGHPAIATENDGSDIGAQFTVRAVVLNTTVTVYVCAVIAGTPAAKVYNITVF